MLTDQQVRLDKIALDLLWERLERQSNSNESTSGSYSRGQQCSDILVSDIRRRSV